MADRAAMLMKMLEANPDDAFARYALAMERAKAGDVEGALDGYAEVVRRSPAYVPAYQMAAQLLIEDGRMEDAQRWLVDGIAQAQLAGNTKARGEMSDLLDEVERSL